MEDLKAKIEAFRQKIATGVITTRPDIVYRCLGCRDTGQEDFVDGQGIERVRQCTQCDYWARKRGITPGVPDDELASTLDNYKRTKDNAQAIDQAQQFLDGVHPNLFVYGPVGTGKTRLACSLANTEWRRQVDTLFIRCPELLMRLQPGGDDDNETGAWFDKVTKVTVLVLDDIGAQQGTDFARRMLQSIYDKRLDLGNRTVFTSNLTLDDLATFLGDDRLPSRIGGSAKVVKLDGKDHRMANAKAGQLVGAKATGERRGGGLRRAGDDDRRHEDRMLPTGDRD